MKGRDDLGAWWVHPRCLKHLCFTTELQRDLGELQLIPSTDIPQDNTGPWLERG